ncbi:MAG: nitroreductase [Marinilabiliales bacterium]|nr:MAG: nitroreductase [Marinilabiliales bacterium]
MLKELVNKNRSYRRFNSERKIGREELLDLVDNARVTASSKNRQPLKYKLFYETEDVDFVFKQLSWAWYLKDWKGPEEAERPTAYIAVFLDKELNDNAFIDVGIASQTILLSAVEKGLGGCIIRTVNRYRMRKRFEYSTNLDLVQIIALGEPVQEIKIVDLDESGSIEYFENEQRVHFVPKRSLKEIIID